MIPTKEQESYAHNILGTLKSIVRAWNETGLDSYRIYFKKLKNGKWELYCPEFEELNITTDWRERERHHETPLWHGLSRAYWLSNLIFGLLPKYWQMHIMVRTYFREHPVTYLSRNNKVLDFWDDVHQ